MQYIEFNLKYTKLIHIRIYVVYSIFQISNIKTLSNEAIEKSVMNTNLNLK